MKFNQVGATVCSLALSFLAINSALADPITIAALKGSSTAPIFIAEARGYFKAQNLEVKMLYIDAASAAPLAVVSGDADFTVVGLTAGFFNLAGKGALKIIGPSVREQKGYRLSGYIASNAAYEAGLRSAKDLAGKKIAITTVGSTYHYNIGTLADAVGFDINTVRMVPLQSQSNQASAVAGNTVDAAIISGYVVAKMEAEKRGKIIGWVSDYTPYQTSVAITSTRNAETKRDLVERFLKAYRAGIKDYHEAFLTKSNAGEPQKGRGYDELLKVLSGYIGQPSEQLEGFLPYVDPQGRLDVKNVYEQVAWWQANNLVDKSVKAANLIDMTYVLPAEDKK